MSIRWGIIRLAEIFRGNQDPNNSAFPYDKEKVEAFAVAITELAFEKARRRNPSEKAIECIVPLAMILIKNSKCFVKTPQGKAAAVCDHYSLEDWGPVAIEILTKIIRKLPKNLGEDVTLVDVPMWAILSNPAGFMTDLATFMIKPSSPARGPMWPLVERIEQRADKIRGFEPELLNEGHAFPSIKETPEELLQTLFRATPFPEMMSVWLPVTISIRDIHEQAHGMGKTGAGKTTFTLSCIWNWIGIMGLCIIDTKGGLAERIIRRHHRPESIIHFDAMSDDMRPIFNIMQAPIGTSPERVAATVQFVLSGLKIGFTDQQMITFEMVTKMVAFIPGATLMTMVHALQDSGTVEPYLSDMPSDVVSWYRSQYGTRETLDARSNIERKIWKLAGNKIVKKYLSGTRNTLDIEKILNNNMTLIVTVDQNYFGEFTSSLCRAILTSISSAMWRRKLPLSPKLNTWLIVIDEYFKAVGEDHDEIVQEILTQGRERKVAMWITHQQFAGQMSSALEATITQNAAVKFYNINSLTEARKLAPAIGCAPTDMMNMGEGDEDYGYFRIWLNSTIKSAALARVDFRFTEKKPSLGNREYHALLDIYRKFWAQQNGDAADPIEGDIIPPEGSEATPETPDLQAEVSEIQTGSNEGNVVSLFPDGEVKNEAMPWTRK